MTVVDFVQCGIAFLLLCLNLGDVRLELKPLCFACRDAAMTQNANTAGYQ